MNYVVYFLYGDEHAQMCSRSIDTVRNHMHHPHVVVYCDKPYDCLVGKAEIRVSPYFDQPPMVCNLLCQTDHLMRLELTPHSKTFTIFLDTDILMTSDLPALSEEPDLFVTWRDNVGKVSEHMPYNYGVIIARHTIATGMAFQWLLQRVLKLQGMRQKWYGNQIALRELVGPLQKDSIHVRDLGYFSLTIEQLPCFKWNWTPPETKPKMSPSSKVFTHLKGDRKDLFDYYYEKGVAA